MILLTKKFPAIALVSIVLVTGFAGCKTIMHVKAEPGTVAYERGTLATTLNTPLDKVQKAVGQTLRSDFKFKIVETKEDAICAYYEARTALDAKVLIRLERTADTQTLIDIKVGLMGDKDISRAILDAINKRLE